MNMNKFAEAQDAILKYAKALYLDKLVAGTSGNISLYDPEQGLIVITPGSEDYMTMTRDRVMVIDLDGAVIAGGGKPSSEWRLHAGIYKSRSDIKAVVHTHSPYATGFAVLHENIPVILIEMIPWLRGDIKIAEFAIPGTAEVGMKALEVLADRHACLLANHGVLAVGDTIQKAYTRASYVEDAAKIYYLAKTSGTPRLVAEDAQKIMFKKFF